MPLDLDSQCYAYHSDNRIGNDHGYGQTLAQVDSSADITRRNQPQEAQHYYSQQNSGTHLSDLYFEFKFFLYLFLNLHHLENDQ